MPKSPFYYPPIAHSYCPKGNRLDTSHPSTLIGETDIGQPTLFMFPGQGEQHVGMAKELAEASPAAKAVMEEADDILGFSLSQLCFEGPEESLNDTLNSQPAVLAASIAALAAMEERLQSMDGKSDASHKHWVAGHSLGEYSALVAAGAFSYPDALRLVRERGRLMKQAGEEQPGRMAAILGLDDDQVATICQEVSETHGIVQIANYNCPGQIVISGEQNAVDAAMAACQANKARKVVPLAVSVAAHSLLMKPAVEELAAAIEDITISSPSLPVIANTTVAPLTSESEIKAELVAQLTGSVRWTATIQSAVDQGIKSYIELGPGKTLTSLVKRIDRKSNRININSPEAVASFIDSL